MDLNMLSPYIRVAMYSNLPKKWILPKRVIYDYEIIYVQSGSCNIIVDGIDNICTSGKVVFLRPGIPHSFNVSENEVFCQPHIHFDAQYSPNSKITPISFKDISQMTEKEKSLISDDVFNEIAIPVVFEPENGKEFKKYFFELLNHYRDNSTDIIKLKSLMLEILRLILNQFSDPEKNHLRKYNMLSSVVEYIDANHMNVISLDDISSYFSCNKYTLLRSFKEKYGETVISYYNTKRFETACGLLYDTALSIKEISEMLHFSDEYTFSRFFKNKCGSSPSAYRSNIKRPSHT